MIERWIALVAGVVFLCGSEVSAQGTSIAIGISDWTGFAPLTLAKVDGLFRKRGLDVSLVKLPQAERQAAMAAGRVQCAAATIESWIIWDAAGLAARQILQLDKSFGADGIVSRPEIESITDLKGKRIAASAPGTSSFFFLTWVLAKNGLRTQDATIVDLDPARAAEALLAGRVDAAATYEPSLSSLRARPDVSRILTTTLDYPVVTDTFGCLTAFVDTNRGAVEAIVSAYFEALDEIGTDQVKAYGTMAADLKQSAAQFGASAQYLRWPDRDENRAFFLADFNSLSNDAARLLLETNLIKRVPDLTSLVDTRFLK